VRIRRADAADVAYLVGLVTDDDVAPFLASVRPASAGELRDEILRSEADPVDSGMFVIEVEGERAGTMAFRRVNRRSRIASLEGLAVDPRHRGRGVADAAARQLQRHLIDDLGFHRLQLEVYAFNERAIRHAERAGFVREGVRRKAYWRNDTWVDGVLFGLVAEEWTRDEQRRGKDESSLRSASRGQASA
jgi:RimJ/RimL family protein N-acetyltransferase